MRKEPFPVQTEHPATRKLERVHSDVAGPSRTPALHTRHTFAINFVDEYTGHSRVYTMARKSDAVKMLQRYIREVGKPEGVHRQSASINLVGIYLHTISPCVTFSRM